MATAIVLLLLVAFSVGLSCTAPNGRFAGAAPADRDRERQLEELRAHR